MSGPIAGTPLRDPQLQPEPGLPTAMTNAPMNAAAVTSLL